MTSLMSAQGVTKRVSEAEIMAIPAPEWTPTWHPVSHGMIVQAMAGAVEHHGIAVRDRQYSVNEAGSRMFGVWTLDLGNGGMKYALGFRNSTDKSMVVGITAGTTVMVCDNMCFSGSFIAFRKHTSGLDLPELEDIAGDAVEGAVIKMDRFYEWHQTLHEHYVPKPDFKAMCFDMMTGGVFSPGQLGNYLTCLDEEKQIIRGKSLDRCTSLFNVHGAATRLMRSWNLLRVADATKALNGICDEYMLANAA